MNKELLYYQILNLGIKIKKSSNIEEKLENIIKKYYEETDSLNPYINSKNHLVSMMIEGKFPTVDKWDKIAKEEGYLSHISIEYIAGCNWKKLKKNLMFELKEIIK